MGLFQTTDQRERWGELQAAESRGEIHDLRPWPRIRLTEASVPFTATYGYTDAQGTTVFESLKEGRDPTFKLIVRLWQRYGPGTLRSTTRRAGRTVDLNDYHGPGQP